MNSNHDGMRSFLSMGAQIAEEIRKKLDEAATNLGSTGVEFSDDQIAELADQIKSEFQAQITTEVERAITRLGVAREDEIAALRARIEKLEG